jgi:hypothetical protein
MKIKLIGTPCIFKNMSLSLIFVEKNISSNDNFSNNSSTSCVWGLCGVTVIGSINDVIKRHLNVMGWGGGFLGAHVVHVVGVDHAVHVTISRI